MIGRQKADTISDAELKFLLKKHDPVMPPTTAELLALEHRILAQVDAQRGRSISSNVPGSLWKTGKQWILGGVAAGVFCVMLGFGVGREFDDLFSQPADSNALYAAAGDASWPSFILAPVAGESDDNAE
jgi:hypothetical protein